MVGLSKGRLGRYGIYTIKYRKDNRVAAWAEVISGPSEAELGSVGRSHRKVFLLIVRKDLAPSTLFKARVDYVCEVVSSLSLRWRLEIYTLR